jgi:hypothetical protein
MEYRGIQYQVVQAANPTGWKWTVTIDGKCIKMGSSFSRLSATRLAEVAIEKHLKAAARQMPRGAISTSHERIESRLRGGGRNQRTVAALSG